MLLYFVIQKHLLPFTNSRHVLRDATCGERTCLVSWLPLLVVVV